MSRARDIADRNPEDITVTGDATFDTDTLYVDSANNRVGIGTASPSAAFHVDIGTGTDNLQGVLIESTDDGSASTPDLTLYRNSATPADDDFVGALWFYGNDDTLNASSYAGILGVSTDVTSGTRDGALAFYTAGSGAIPSESARIDSRGNLLVGTTSTINATTPQLTVHGDSTGQILELYRSTSTAGADCLSIYTNVGGTENRNFYVEADGDTFNTNNSYGGISDERYKQDIVDAQSQWNDIKSVEIKNYRLKNMVEHMGDDAPVHLGVIAQQLETAGMSGLVTTKVDDVTGVECKTVKYSVLYMKAIGALQEALNKIDDLEARVAALEAK